MPDILVAGVAVLDFIFHMDSFPRTAEKYRAKGANITGGGNAANAAVAIARLGGNAILAARTGDDQVAELIISGLQKEAVDTSLIKRFAACRSSFSSIYIDEAGERQIMNYRDMEISMDADWLEKSAPINLGACLADTRWPNGARVAMEQAAKLGIPGVIDAEAPVLEAKDAVECASHVAFSAQGIRDYTGKQSIEEAACSAASKLEGIIYVTDGGNDVVRVKNNQLSRFPTYTIEPVDTLGAGDVWHGAFTLALAEGKDDPSAIAFANAAAAYKCSRQGGRDAAPTRSQIEDFQMGKSK